MSFVLNELLIVVNNRTTTTTTLNRPRTGSFSRDERRYILINVLRSSGLMDESLIYPQQTVVPNHT